VNSIVRFGLYQLGARAIGCKGAVPGAEVLVPPRSLQS